MDHNIPRKLNLADSMIAVGFFALGMGSLRVTLPAMTIQWFHRRRTAAGPLGSTGLYFEMALAHGVPLLVLASLLVVTLTLRHSGRPLRRLARRPGFVVPLAAVGGAGLTVAVIGTFHYVSGDPYPNSLVDVIAYGIVFNVGYMVLGAWMASSLAGRRGWRASALDRIGLYLGTVWVMLFVLTCIDFVLSGAGLM